MYSSPTLYLPVGTLPTLDVVTLVHNTTSLNRVILPSIYLNSTFDILKSPKPVILPSDRNISHQPDIPYQNQHPSYPSILRPHAAASIA